MLLAFLGLIAQATAADNEPVTIKSFSAPLADATLVYSSDNRVAPKEAEVPPFQSLQVDKISSPIEAVSLHRFYVSFRVSLRVGVIT